MADSQPQYTFPVDYADLAEGPWTDAAMQANLVFRVMLGILAVLLLVVPTRLLWRNGEFAAAIFCVTLCVLNFFWSINALIWRDDNVAGWWPGYGWCDLQAYTLIPLATIENSCIFEIMRGMYYKISLNRATGLTRAEKFRGQLVSAAIIFSIPVLQLALTFVFLTARFNVSTLIGCQAVYNISWPTILVYLMPVLVFTLGAFAYAVAIYVRFRALEKTTRSALGNTNNSHVSFRQNKIRRKLYLLCSCIIGPYVPLQLAFLALNIQAGMPWIGAFDWGLNHIGDPAHPNYTIVTLTQSAGMPWAFRNVNYITVLTAVPVFLIFGTTADAINAYRECLLAVGLGKFFPRLHEPYEENRRSGTRSTFTGTGNTTSSSTRPDKRPVAVLPVKEEPKPADHVDDRWSVLPVEEPRDAQLPPRKTTFLTPDLGAMARSVNTLLGKKKKEGGTHIGGKL